MRLQCVAVCCSVVQCVAVYFGLQRNTSAYTTLQYNLGTFVALQQYCNRHLFRVFLRASMQRNISVYLSYMYFHKSAAVCCSMLQCVAVCCIVLLCVANLFTFAAELPTLAILDKLQHTAATHYNTATQVLIHHICISM